MTILFTVLLASFGEHLPEPSFCKGPPTVPFAVTQVAVPTLTDRSDKVRRTGLARVARASAAPDGRHLSMIDTHQRRPMRLLLLLKFAGLS